MNRITLRLFALSFFLASTGICASIYADPAGPLVGSKAPALKQKKNGKVGLIKPAEYSRLLAQSKGKVLVVNFWATWCAPCVAEFPEFTSIDQKYRQQGVKVVGISADELSDIDSKVIPFVKKQKAQFRIAVQAVDDPQEMIDVVDKKWGGELPATFVYDKRGNRVFVKYGIIDRDQLVEAIDKALKS